ncbi:MAG: amidohydrolase [Pirellulales bacterium]|nr:amidohydrolase [Pirellulales bacterium]
MDHDPAPYNSPINRRTFLAQSTCVAGVAMTGSVIAMEEPKAKGGFIDAHSHVWTPDVKSFPLGSWTSKDKMKPAGFTDRELMAVARPAGVDRVVLIQHAPYYGYDNSYMFDCRRRNPGMFSIVAMMDERKPDISGRLAKLVEQGTRGLRIGPTKHADRTLVKDPPNWLKSDGMQTLWKCAADQGVAVCPLLGSKFLSTLAPMCAKFPETTCVIDHFGHVDHTKKDDIGQLLALAKHKNVHVKVSAFYKFGDKKAPYDDLAPLVRPVFEAFGPDRLMWASDCPYQLQNGNNYRDSVALISKELDFLEPSDRDAILRKTAERVFFS